MARTPHYGLELSHGGHIPTLRALNEGLTKIDAELKRISDNDGGTAPETIRALSYIHGCNLEVDVTSGTPLALVTGGEVYVPGAERLLRIETSRQIEVPAAQGLHHFFIDRLGNLISSQTLPENPYAATARADPAGARYIGSWYRDENNLHSIISIGDEVLYDGAAYPETFHTVTATVPYEHDLTRIMPVGICHKLNVTVETRNGVVVNYLRVTGTRSVQGPGLNGKIVSHQQESGIHHIGKVMLDDSGFLSFLIGSGTSASSVDVAAYVESYSFER